MRAHLASIGAGHGCEPGGVGDALARAFGARIEPGAPVRARCGRVRPADARRPGVDRRRGRLDVGALTGRVLGEAATRARQAGIPTHAIVGFNRLDRFDARILDLQEIVEAATPDALRDAASWLAARL